MSNHPHVLDDNERTSLPARPGEPLPSEPAPASSPAPPAVARTAADEEIEDADLLRIEKLPKEVGAMLVSVGVLGVVLPGMMGTPAIIAGGLVLWPNTFQRVENWFQSRYPSLHRKGMKQIGRYLDDMERRFPPASDA